MTKKAFFFSLLTSSFEEATLKINTPESKTGNLLWLLMYKKRSWDTNCYSNVPLFFLPHLDKVFSERTNHLFVWYQQRKTWGTGAPDEMSDGRKCFQQLLLQWVEHIQSIPKQIKSSGQSERGGGVEGKIEPAATELDGDRRNTKRRSTFEPPVSFYLFFLDAKTPPWKPFTFSGARMNHLEHDAKTSSSI